MINILPDKDKDLIKKEYFRRLFVVAGIFLLSLFFFAIILLLPSYFLLSSYNNDSQGYLAAIKGELGKEKAGELESSAEKLNSKINFLLGEQEKSEKISSLMKKILETKTDAVKLTGFSYQKDSTAQKTVTIRGLALKRNNLVVFTENLEKTEGISDVISPASNILKEKDIEFSLTLKLSY